MRVSVFWFVSCLALASVSALTAQVDTELVIDDFKESPYRKVLWNHPALLTEYQTGPNIVGGVRQTNFTASQAPPYVGQSTLLQIHPNGPLVINGDYKSYFGLYLGYGFDTAGGANRLDLDLSGDGNKCLKCDRFRISLDGCESELSYAMQVYDRNGNIATMFGTESTTGRILPFPLDFPFGDFVPNSDEPIDWHHIDFIFVLFQTGNSLGGHDFLVTRISAIPDPTPQGAVD